MTAKCLILIMLLQEYQIKRNNRLAYFGKLVILLGHKSFEETACRVSHSMKASLWVLMIPVFIREFMKKKIIVILNLLIYIYNSMQCLAATSQVYDDCVHV